MKWIFAIILCPISASIGACTMFVLFAAIPALAIHLTFGIDPFSFTAAVGIYLGTFGAFIGLVLPFLICLR